MTRHAVPTVSLLTVSMLLALTAGCGSSTRATTSAVNVAEPSVPAAPRLLTAFDDGVGLVPSGSSTPVWREPGAVAALDGSAVFSLRAGAGGTAILARLDARTGAASSTWPAPTSLTIAAVAPAGKWVALTNRQPGYGSQGRASTHLVVFDATAGTTSDVLSLAGDIQPEAFSVDGEYVFALHYSTDHYRVQTIELATGSVVDTTDRDKTPFEDMHGHAVHGVLSTDRTLLATLYRDPTNVDEPAFVHVLDLAHNWSYCADLPAPFGTGAPGADAIRLTADDVVEVAARPANRLARIRIDAVHKPLTPVAVVVTTGTIAPPPATLTSIAGFDYVIGTLPA